MTKTRDIWHNTTNDEKEYLVGAVSRSRNKECYSSHLHIIDLIRPEIYGTHDTTGENLDNEKTHSTA